MRDRRRKRRPSRLLLLFSGIGCEEGVPSNALTWGGEPLKWGDDFLTWGDDGEA
ncbi:hypothetical protein [Candidatus Poriferisodalis sp.]|uniref:hypothetical protein n=1 Tax=Candidatus Poriferisodalis sp. TaxID=3101277 RepID=UPI003B01ED53